MLIENARDDERHNGGNQRCQKPGKKTEPERSAKPGNSEEFGKDPDPRVMPPQHRKPVKGWQKRPGQTGDHRTQQKNSRQQNPHQPPLPKRLTQPS